MRCASRWARLTAGSRALAIDDFVRQFAKLADEHDRLAAAFRDNR
jgi:hypothetical protein